MSDKESKSQMSQKIKRVFMAGILTCLPIIITIYIILLIYHLLTKNVIPIVKNVSDRLSYTLNPILLDVIAFIFVFILIFLIGLIGKAYLGKKIIQFIDYIMMRIPIARTVYKGTKQVIDSLSSTTGSSFSKVVLVEYPRRDMWSLGFVVRDALPFISESCGYKEAYSVFVPTSPNPTSGFIVVVAKDDARDVDMSVEDGIKYVFSISLVNIIPKSQQKIQKKKSKVQK